MLSADKLQFFTWVITVLSLIGTVLNIKKSIWCFYIWTFGNTAWLLFDVHTGYYSRATLDAVHLVFAVWGIVAWKKKHGNE